MNAQAKRILSSVLMRLVGPGCRPAGRRSSAAPPVKLNHHHTLIALFFIILVGGLVLGGCSKSDPTAKEAAKEKTLYTCGMHPQVVQDHPGDCPICGMKLTPILKPTGSADERKVKFYRSTMNPGETSPSPARDSMGMDMVPVYAEETAGTNSSAIRVDPATIQSMNLRTTEVTRGPFRRGIRTVGTVVHSEAAIADVTTKFKGWVEKLYVDTTGMHVHRGDPMVEIYSPELYSAEVEYLLALNQTATNDPGVAILRDTAASKLRFYDISEAQIAGLEKTRQPRKTLTVGAPIDGYVMEKMVVSGQMVEPGMKLYELVNHDTVWVLAQVYEQDLPLIQPGQEVLVSVTSLPGAQFRGRVAFIYPTLDEKTRTATIRAEFHNPGHLLKPGMFATVQINAEVETSALLVPDSAILRSGRKNLVFVALPGGRFDPRAVVLGPEAENDRYQVISGLAAGERVVTSGQFMLDSESQLREAIDKMRSPEGRGEAIDQPTAITNSSAGDGSPGRSLRPSENSSEPLVYVCPMPEHVSIIYDHAGNCPICNMPLVPVLQSELRNLQPGGKILYYTCPMPEHSDIHEGKPGKCPRCGMTLIPLMETPKMPSTQPEHQP